MSRLETAIIIPARLESTRYPEKLLKPIGGKPLILWTAERLRAVVPEYPLYVAVDSPRLAEPLRASGFSVVETDPDLPSGTDRLAEANGQVGAEAVINIQGDEPLVNADQVHALAQLIGQEGVDIATLATPFQSVKAFEDPSRVKVVVGANGEALYFSRAPIPFERDGAGRWSGGSRYLHLGMYAYRSDFLRSFRDLPPGRLEELERLEQLRALEHGYRIRVGITEHGTFGIDTEADAKAFARMVEGAEGERGE